MKYKDRAKVAQKIRENDGHQCSVAFTDWESGLPKHRAHLLVDARVLERVHVGNVQRVGRQLQTVALDEERAVGFGQLPEECVRHDCGGDCFCSYRQVDGEEMRPSAEGSQDARYRRRENRSETRNREEIEHCRATVAPNEGMQHDVARRLEARRNEKQGSGEDCKAPCAGALDVLRERVFTNKLSSRRERARGGGGAALLFSQSHPRPGEKNEKKLREKEGFLSFLKTCGHLNKDSPDWLTAGSEIPV
jgi:hypothetical protein